MAERGRALIAALRRVPIALAVYALLRVPSFLEPHWYTDEGSYVGVARALLRGRMLYSQIWNNKPPLQSWTVALEVRVFGSSEAGLHLLTFITGAVALAAVVWAARRLLTARRALVASLLAAVALGLPVLDAELAIPESLLIAPLAWAGALLVVRLDPRHSSPSRTLRGWPVIVGVLAAAAIAYQQTAVAEASAFGLVLLLSPRAGWRAFALYAGTLVAITGAWLAVAIAQAGASTVEFALIGFYVAYTQSVFPTTASGIALHLVEVGIATVLLAAGAYLARRLPTISWALVLWAGAALMVPALSRQPYAHYLTSAAIPLSILVASAPLPRALRTLNWQNVLRITPQLAGLLMAASMASVAGLDWIPAASPSPLLNASRTLGMYYGGAVTAAVSASARADWDSSFDSRVTADQAVTDFLETKGLSGSTAVVWSSDAWLYALADLEEQMPTPPIYNDEVLLGINGPVAQRVSALNPSVIVVADDASLLFPEVSSVLDGTRYVEVYSSDPDTVWVRGDVVAALSSLAGPTLP